MKALPGNREMTEFLPDKSIIIWRDKWPFGGTGFGNRVDTAAG
jgi:hypothetical protein